MKHFLLLNLFLLCFYSLVFAQREKLVSGILTDDEGNPIPGVNIVVKGTDRGTISDINGYYEINAPLGATLIFSAVGMITREMTVQDESLPNAKKRKRNQSSRNQALIKPAQSPEDSIAYDYRKASNQRYSILNYPKRIGVLKKNSPSYRFEEEYWNWQRIEQIPMVYHIRKTMGKGEYVLETRPKYKPRGAPGIKLHYQSSFGFQMANKLPDLQSSFVQGRPIEGTTTWQGAETNETFSWGPALNSLEFDGNNYLFDQNGRLTSRGNGNGQNATVYDPLDFLRTAYQSHQSLQLGKHFGLTELYAKVHYSRQKAIINQSNTEQWNISFKNKWHLNKFKIQTSLYYQKADNQLPAIGANWQTILGAMYRTPVSFDNANGLQRKEAVGTEMVYLLRNGIQRSHSPRLVDNPFALVNTIPDQRNEQVLISKINLTHYGDKLNFTAFLGYEASEVEKQFGLLPFHAGVFDGRFTERVLENKQLSGLINPQFLLWGSNFYNNHLVLGFKYRLQYLSQDLNRLDASGFQENMGFDLNQADFIEVTEFARGRWTHQPQIELELKAFDDLLLVKVANQMYVSSTLDSEEQKYFLPSVSLKLDFYSYLGGFGLENIKFYANYSSHIQEAPLVYNQWHFNTLNLRSADYAQYYEDREILLTESLSPERHHKLDIGARFEFGENINFAISYFNNQTKGMLVPIRNRGSFSLENMADIRNQGWEMNLSTYQYFRYLSWQSDLNFSRNSPIVTNLERDFPVPISGYQDISGNLIEGEPLGVILGTRFLRNEAGQMIIGDDGLPLVDFEQRPLGNPNPDFVLGWFNSLSYHMLSLSFTLEYRHGGEIWNGTQQALNFLGRSQVSADQRNTSGFVFPGVRIDGSANQIPVDFANPQGINANRWVRYGWSGVGEEAIESASSLRLNEIKFSFNFNKYLKTLLPKGSAQISIYARNILLATAYSGIDPSTNLLNYNQAIGLDLFNTPGMSSYGIQLDLKL